MKRKSKQVLDSDSGASSSDEEQSKKRKRPESASSSSSDDEQDDDFKPAAKGRGKQPAKKPAAKKAKSGRGTAPDSDDDSDSDGSWADKFTDGFDENLMGDEEDQKRLAAMTEKEREQEIFKRIEQRDALKNRYMIEKKLRAQKKREGKSIPAAPDASSDSDSDGEIEDTNKSGEAAEDSVLIDEDDAKMRSKARVQTMEDKRMNQKSDAFSMLKAKREKREEKEKRLAEAEAAENEKDSDGDRTSVDSSADDEDEGPNKKEDQAKEKVKKKKKKKKEDKEKRLKTSEVYSSDSSKSDSDSDGDEEKKVKRGTSSSSSSGSSSSSSSGSSSSSSSSSDSDSDGEKPKRAEPMSEPITTKDELNKIKLSRHKCEKWVHMPYFTETVKGCVVRIGIGQNPQTNQPVYRVGEILDVRETAKIYTLGSTKTNKGFLLRNGDQERVFRLEFISNQGFTDSEFQKYVECMSTAGISLPTKKHVEEKSNHIRKAVAYELKDAEVELVVKEKERFRAGPRNFALKKTQLFKDKDMAQARGDSDEAARIGRVIQELEERAEELDRNRTSTLQSIAYINERNRKKNVLAAETAIIEEAKANKGKKKDDPFTRRSTRPTMMTRHGLPVKVPSSNNPSRDVSPDADLLQHSASSSQLMSATEKENKDEKKPGDEKVATDLFSAHDFDINIELVPGMAVLPPAAVPATTKTAAPSARDAPKRCLNLDDYKKRKGLI